MTKRFISILFLLSLLALTFQPAQAQDASGPIYIVQSGDSLSTIASRFSITLEALMTTNNITDPNQLDVGQQLVIPGLEGITGILSTESINFGDSFRSLMRRTQISQELFKKMNHVVSPSEFYVGVSLIVPVDETNQNLTTRVSTRAGESLLELAVKQNTDVWTLSHYNNLKGSWDGLPGDTLFTTGGSEDQNASGLPSAFVSAEIRDLPIKQGGTGVIMVKTIPNVTLGGILVDQSLRFFPTEDGTQVAFQGVHALLDPGVYPLRLDATLPDGSKQSYEQSILIVSGYYDDITISVPSETLNPSVTEPENQQIASIVSATTTRAWQGEFNIPVALPFCIKDWFGIRRTYLGQGTDIKLNGFHSGLDYGVCSEANPYDIYAPAPGTVVFSAPLTVRGNATIIDHGWGVYSGLFHQEESYVTVGQVVKTGELVGKIGATGRVTGAHLHWEIWANGVQVDPLDWLNQAYP